MAGFVSLSPRLVSMRSPIPLSPTGKGKIIWQDDFESTNCKWTNMTHVDTAGIVLSGSHVGKINSAAGSETSGYKYIPIVPEVISGKIGVSMDLRLSSTAGTDLLHFRQSIEISDGTNIYTAQIKWLLSDLKFYYYNSAGNYVDTGFTNVTAQHKWYRMKLIINMLTHTYDKLYFGSQVMDMSTLALKSVASTRRDLSPSIGLHGVAAGSVDMFIDNIMFTYDED